LIGHRVWSPQGKPAVIINGAASLQASFSLTALMCLEESQPIVLDLREDTNTEVCVKKSFINVLLVRLSLLRSVPLGKSSP
jgi:hypothetical protein